MNRILKFIGAFLGVAALIFVLIFGLNRDSFELLFENREAIAEGSEWVEKTYSLKGLTEYIAEHPEMVSVASIVIGNPDSTLMFREHTPRTMGTLSNLFLFIAYADAFEQGEVDPRYQLTWDQISRYQLPEIGENLHNDTYRFGRRNGLIDDDGILTLENALQLLTKHNSLALSDYLLHRIGTNKIETIYRRLSLEFTDYPLPFSGLLITTAPSIQKTTPSELIRLYSETSRTGFEETVYENSEEFISGNQREEWINVLSRERQGLSFIEERNLLSLYPSTTAGEITRVMYDLVTGRLISAEVSRQVLDWLRYPMEEAALKRNFREYGALYDNRIGLLNGIDFGISQYTGDTTVQAVFFDRIHIAVWFHMSSNHMHQDFQQRLIWDPALIESMKEAINNHSS